MAGKKQQLPWQVRTNTAILADCWTADIAAAVAALNYGHTWITYHGETVWDSKDNPVMDRNVIAAIATRKGYGSGA